MDGQQLVRRLTAQAGDMAGTLQHGVRTLIPCASSPDVISQGQADEFARLREQLRRKRQINFEMKQMLQN